MKKSVMISAAIVSMCFSGCANNSKEEVYTFSGENEMVTLEDGKIIVDGNERTYEGGEITLSSDVDSSKFMSCEITIYYENSQDEKLPLLEYEYPEDSKPIEIKAYDIGSITSSDSYYLVGIDELKNNLYVDIMGQIGDEEYQIITLPLHLDKE